MLWNSRAGYLFASEVDRISGAAAVLNQSASILDSQRAANLEALQPFEVVGARRLSGWRGTILHVVLPPGQRTVRASSHLAMILMRPNREIEVSTSGETARRFDAATGTLEIVPEGWERAYSWPSIQEAVVVAIGNQTLESMAKVAGSPPIELRPPHSGTVDLTALRLGRLMRQELAREQPSQIAADSLITLMGMHLVRNYNATIDWSARARGGLSETNARKLKTYINENFRRKITISQLAALSNLSESHFQQAFARTFGESPHRTIVKMRLDFAVSLMRDTDRSLAEIAFLSGFASQSHMTSTMKKFMNVTPNMIRTIRN